jgi:hypothetical protein
VQAVRAGSPDVEDQVQLGEGALVDDIAHELIDDAAE